MTHGNINFQEALAAAKAHPHWSAPLGSNQGRGVAAGYWGNYGGDSTVVVSVAEDGSVTVATGNPDIGGTRASQAMMAAETLGIAYENVRPIVADTASIGFSMLTGGSRTTFATGKAIVLAAEAVVEQLKTRAARLWSIPVEQVEWRDGEAICRDQSADKAPLGIAAIAAKASITGGPISAEISINPNDYAPAFAVHICDVEVDPETGQTSIKRYTALQDVGRAIHPSYVEGQVQGGAAQGIGWALNEAYVYDAAGRVDNAGFLDYRMPVASDLPMIDAVLVEIPNPSHPYGAKGVGEVPIVPPLAAVANAVRDATGIRFHALPLSPQRVFAALKQAG
jgi:CO/xanthine dehydrogenase Mo-binding subunit